MLLFSAAAAANGCGVDHGSVVSETAPGVYRVAASRSNVYILDGPGLVIVDTGMKGDEEAVLQAIENMGRKPGDVTHILITHAHIDHTGSLAVLKEKTGAQVVASAHETEFVAGTKKTSAMGRQGLGGKIFKAVLYVLETFIYPYDGTGVDIACRGGEVLDICGPVHVLATPGHSPGSLSFLMPEKGVMFTGDALTGVGGPGLPPRAGCADYDQALRSAKTISEQAFDVCCFGHGEPVRVSADAIIGGLLH